MFSSEKLTIRQSEILNFLNEFQYERGFSPTYREISDYFGFKSTKAVADHLAALEKKGYIRRYYGCSRGIEILFRNRGKKGNTVSVPILGNIPAGSPEIKNEQYGRNLMVDAGILDQSAKHRLFALQVKGESMTGRGIYNGDWIVADADLASHEGDLVVALIDGENTLKTLARHKDSFFFKAENPKYPDLTPAEEIVIQGVVKMIIRTVA